MNGNYSFIGDWLRRLRRPLAGLRFDRERCPGRVILAARHYPHLLCWSWFIERQDAADPRMGLHHDGGIHFSLHNSGGYIVVGRWWLHWQNYRIPALTVSAAPERKP